MNFQEMLLAHVFSFKKLANDIKIVKINQSLSPRAQYTANVS